MSAAPTRSRNSPPRWTSSSARTIPSSRWAWQVPWAGWRATRTQFRNPPSSSTGSPPPATSQTLERAREIYRDLHSLLRWDSKTEFVQSIKLSMDVVGLRAAPAARRADRFHRTCGTPSSATPKQPSPRATSNQRTAWSGLSEQGSRQARPPAHNLMKQKESHENQPHLPRRGLAYRRHAHARHHRRHRDDPRCHDGGASPVVHGEPATGSAPSS